MSYLSGVEEQEVIKYIQKAIEIANSATCDRCKSGSVIVKNGEIIGLGFNSPPGDKENQRRCNCDKDSYHKKVADKTCCVHAEQRAIMDALRKNPEKIVGSRLYFVRTDNGNVSYSGKPYCTICSKMSLDVGILEFVLWSENGICVYDTEEYNNISFGYTE